MKRCKIQEANDLIPKLRRNLCNACHSQEGAGQEIIARFRIQQLPGQSWVDAISAHITILNVNHELLRREKVAEHVTSTIAASLNHSKEST